MLQAVERPKLEALTGLRYWAAMLIFVHHAMYAALGDQAPTLWGTSLPRPDLASIGMPLFFTLSGFLMFYNYFAKFEEKFGATLRSFLVARFARIYPLYIFAALVSFSVMGNFFHDLRDRPDDTKYCLSFGITLTQSWYHDLVFQDYNPRSVSMAFLQVAWSVSVEVFFYLTFPFLCVPIMRRMTSVSRILGTAIAVFVVYAGVDLLIGTKFRDQAGGNGMFSHHSLPGWLLYISPYGRYGEFLLGCLAGGLFSKLSAKPLSRGENIVGNLVLCTGIAVMVGLSFVHADLNRGWVLYCLRQNIGNAPLCAAVIFCLARYRSPIQSFLGKPLLVLLGEASYGIYLMHPIVQTFYLTRSVGEFDITSGKAVWFNHLAMTGVLHMLCLGTYQFIETPARVALRNWLGGRPGRKPTLKVHSTTEEAASRAAA